jgi:NADH-quinone oxidoreductase subunit A
VNPAPIPEDAPVTSAGIDAGRALVMEGAPESAEAAARVFECTTSSVADRLLRSAAMLSGYAPILFFFGICAAFAVFAQLLNAVLGPKRPSPTKDLPYESGMVPRESARRRFSVSFYVTAMLFIIFDVESIFLFPWATIVRELKVFGIVEMGIFIATLLVGLLYVWRKGALRWD